MPEKNPHGDKPIVPRKYKQKNGEEITNHHDVIREYKRREWNKEHGRPDK